jgi:hypothetical protein
VLVALAVRVVDAGWLELSAPAQEPIKPAISADIAAIVCAGRMTMAPLTISQTTSP